MSKEQDYMRDIASLGCIVCQQQGMGKTPADAHHLIKGGRRIDDFHVIPLCHAHHRAGQKNEKYVSRHPWRSEFERRYGSEWTLLEATRQLYEKEFNA